VCEGAFLVRSLIWIPLTVIVVAAIAWGALRGVRHTVPTRELLLAAGIVLVAGELATLPMILSRGAGPAAVSQSSLLGTLIHLFLSITLAGAVAWMHAVSDVRMFLYLLVGFYWLTLVSLVMLSARAIRASSAASSPNKPQQQH
jgi:hypothetical protein